MPILSLDNLIAAMTTSASNQQIHFMKSNKVLTTTGVVNTGTGFTANFMVDTFRFENSIPGAAGAATSRTSGGNYFTSASTGALPFTNAGLGQESYITSLATTLQMGGVMYLYDRLWEASGFTLANGTASPVAQTVSIGGVTTPPTLTRATDGKGVEALLLCSSTTDPPSVSNSNGTVSLNYTNQDGVSGRSGSMRWLATTPNTHLIGRFGLQGTDTGIQTVTGITIPASGSNPGIGGAGFNLVLARKILELPVNGTGNGVALDALGTTMAKIENDSCLFFILQPAAMTNWSSSFENVFPGLLSGLLTITQG